MEADPRQTGEPAHEPREGALFAGECVQREGDMSDVFAAESVRYVTVVARDDTRELATRHTAANGVRQATLSSRRQRNGLRQRGLRRPADSATERIPTAVRYIDGLRNGWRAAHALRNAMVSDRPVPSTDSATESPAASGHRQTTLSSRRQYDGLRQRSL